MEIENYYIDTAKTGRNTKRPEYQKMKQDIENGNVEAKIILVRAIDRLHRNAKNQLEDVEWCEKYGIRIIGIIDGTDTADSNNKFILTIKAATAEEYSNTYIEKFNSNMNRDYEKDNKSKYNKKTV